MCYLIFFPGDFWTCLAQFQQHWPPWLWWVVFVLMWFYLNYKWAANLNYFRAVLYKYLNNNDVFNFILFFNFFISAAQFIKQKLPDLLRSYVDADLSGNQEGGFQDIAIEVLHLLLSHLLFGQKGASGVGQEQIDAFLKTLCRGMVLYGNTIVQTLFFFFFLHIHTVRMSSKTHMDLFGVCRFRFSPRALSCGARTTSVPWKTGHSHGQDLTRFGGVS